jgi:hypothetical protein
MTRLLAAANNAGCASLEDFARFSDAEVLRQPNCGRKCLAKLRELHGRPSKALTVAHVNTFLQSRKPALSPYCAEIGKPLNNGPPNPGVPLAELLPPGAQQVNGALDVFVVPSDRGTPIKLRTRGASDAWVDLTVDQALDVARELIRLAQETLK